jgi:hypothetical protein
VTSWSCDRGRQFELDRTDGGRAEVRIADRDGILDPQNTGGPYYAKLEPLLQAVLCRWDPVALEWQQRFRGFVSEYDYTFDPSQQINFLTVSLVDIFEILGAIEMVPGAFGDTPAAESAGQVWFDTAGMQSRIEQVLGNAGIPAAFFVVFTGNVDLYPTVYSVGESPMTVIQEAADAEFPGVANVYTDRFGRLAVHGRLAKFDPASIAAGAGDAAWDWHHWHAGDETAVAAAPSLTAQIRRFAFNRGLSKIINSTVATPIAKGTTGIPLAETDIAGQIVTDPSSIGQYGIRSWSAQNLLTKTGLLDGSNSLVETQRYAQYYVDNYAIPQNRVTDIAFRSIRPGHLGSTINWRLLSQIDIADQLDITIASPGGGGFTDTEFFVEGIHETNLPLNGDYDDVTITLDLSPAALFSSNPFPTGALEVGHGVAGTKGSGVRV